MSGEESEESATDTLNAAENDAVDDERLHEVAVEKRRREELEDRRATMGDAEDLCVFLVDDLLAALFQEMQVRSENASLFATSARHMCAQAFEGVAVSAFEPPESLDRIAGSGGPERKGRQQVLKPKSQWASAPQARLPVSLDALPPPLVFLRRFLKFLEAHAERTDLELLRFPMSEAIESLPNKRKLLGVGSSEDGHGEWCIPADQVSAFLLGLLSKGLVSAVPSTVAFVMAANHESLEKRTLSHARVALPHLQQLVHKALLAAEEEEERSAGRRAQARPTLATDKPPKSDAASSWSRIFQTEVPQGQLHFRGPLNGDVEAADRPGEGPERELLSSYLAEIPPRAIAMDRRAPNQVGKKAALSAANPSQRAISRKILLLLAPPPRNGSRWTTVRHKVVVPLPDEASVTTLTAEADMELHLAGDSRQPRAAGLAIQATASEAIAENEETLDAAALTNIFSLGTPRQLSAQELARRNDLLAQLEREATRTQRRATTTIAASMSLGGAPGRRESEDAACPSQAEQQQFQAYVAANSTVMTGVQPGVWTSPTRPERSDQVAAPRAHARGGSLRSKFELERDTLPFSVCDGDAHAREEQERLSAAVCSPIKRPRASIAPSPPETPGRPIQTASTMAHLPQLDSSRLAVGVNAVVRGVEKRGPRRNPSRKSRLELHNYSVRASAPPLRCLVGLTLACWRLPGSVRRRGRPGARGEKWRPSAVLPCPDVEAGGPAGSRSRRPLAVDPGGVPHQGQSAPQARRVQAPGRRQQRACGRLDLAESSRTSATVGQGEATGLGHQDALASTRSQPPLHLRERLPQSPSVRRRRGRIRQCQTPKARSTSGEHVPPGEAELQLVILCVGGLLTRCLQPMAPRRNVLPTASEDDED
jgi:hypothetical protein